MKIWKNTVKFSQFYRFINSKSKLFCRRIFLTPHAFARYVKMRAWWLNLWEKMKNGHPINPHDIVERYTLQKNFVPCITNQCIKCMPHKILESWDIVSEDSEASESNSDNPDNNDQLLTFSMWKGKQEKSKNHCNLSPVISFSKTSSSCWIEGTHPLQACPGWILQLPQGGAERRWSL